MMDDDELVFKECPHCNTILSELYVETIPYMGAGKSSKFGGCVVCNKCGMRGPWGYSHAKAIIMWNSLPREQSEEELC